MVALRMIYVRPIQVLWALWFAYLKPVLVRINSWPTLKRKEESFWSMGITGVLAVAVVILLGAILWFCAPSKVSAAGPEEPKAYDNQSLSTQTVSVQQMFFSTFGANAQVRWIVEHMQELFDKSPWGYGWGTGPFVYERGLRIVGGGQSRLFTAQLHGPYTVQSYQFTLPSTRQGFSGARDTSCETVIHPQLDYQQVALRQGNCTTLDSYAYPYIRADGAKGNRVPVPHPTRPNEYPMTGIFGSGGSGPFKWQIWADDGSMNLVVEVWSILYKPILQVRIPQGQALEVKLPCSTCKDGVTPVTFWNDEQGWHYVWGKSGLEAIQEGGPIWSLWRASFLTIREDGTARYEELPFWKAQG